MKLMMMVPFLLAAQPVFAQDATQPFVAEPRCWLGSASFSPGVVIRASNQRMQCTPEAVWINTEAWSAGCFRAGDFFSVGSVENVPNNEMTIECREDGTWIERPGAQ